MKDKVKFLLASRGQGSEYSIYNLKAHNAYDLLLDSYGPAILESARIFLALGSTSMWSI
jgi:hypothetical protein